MMASTCAFCAPYLVSDPYPKKETKLKKFLITIQGKTSESAPVKNSEGAFYLKYDLGNLPDGTYTATIKAVDSKGKESSPATYSFKKTGTKVEPYTPPVPKQKIPPSRSYPGQMNR
jgi:predicted phage tail protein